MGGSQKKDFPMSPMRHPMGPPMRLPMGPPMGPSHGTPPWDPPWDLGMGEKIRAGPGLKKTFNSFRATVRSRAGLKIEEDW